MTAATGLAPHEWLRLKRSPASPLAARRYTDGSLCQAGCPEHALTRLQLGAALPWRGGKLASLLQKLLPARQACPGSHGGSGGLASYASCWVPGSSLGGMGELSMGPKPRAARSLVHSADAAGAAAAAAAATQAQLKQDSRHGPKVLVRNAVLWQLPADPSCRFQEGFMRSVECEMLVQLLQSAGLLRAAPLPTPPLV
jgi:hypothetical protein